MLDERWRTKKLPMPSIPMAHSGVVYCWGWDPVPEFPLPLPTLVPQMSTHCCQGQLPHDYNDHSLSWPKWSCQDGSKHNIRGATVHATDVFHEVWTMLLFHLRVSSLHLLNSNVAASSRGLCPKSLVTIKDSPEWKQHCTLYTDKA